MNNIYNIIGLMSGSSLDGLDIAYCHFEKNSTGWKYKIMDTVTLPFPTELEEMLRKIASLQPEKFVKADHQLGEFMGKSVNKFITGNNIKNIDYIASHGHTAFHNPEEKYTCQIGNGFSIAIESGITTISDFRSLDIALGGQGAPLVPIGDQLLFNNYTFCLNLGGYSNISFELDEKRIAFDICPVNKIINYLARQLNKNYDHNGDIAKYGKINPSLLSSLNDLDYYKKVAPKSLGDNWLNNIFMPALHNFEISIPDKLRTLYEHISNQVAKATNNYKEGKILTTGGGAHNQFLIECIQSQNKHELVLPDKKLVDFKEALIFALMGVLKIENSVNCLSSVTGASRDNTGGIIHQV